MALPWGAIQQELGVIHVVDIGCGSGQYGMRLLAWSGNRVASYTGVDVAPRDDWERLAAAQRLRFIQADATQLGSMISRDTNMFISQSAIEHVEDDLTLFEQIRAFVDGYARSTLQIHLCPSEACLKLYLLHGVRQYTPRTLSIITRLYGGSSRCYLFRLGGDASNRLHYTFITKPRLTNRSADLRDTRPAEYDRLAFAKIQEDMQRPSRVPAFYALVIHTHPQQPLF